MLDATHPSQGDATSADLQLMSRISNEMVHAQKKFFGRGPTQAKSYMLDDFLIVVMRDGITTAESTMLEFGRDDIVRGFREKFENEMAERLVDMIQELTGRPVVKSQAQVLFDPHIVIQIFFFARDGDPGSPPGEVMSAK